MASRNNSLTNAERRESIARKGSVTADDLPNLAAVETYVADGAARGAQTETNMTLLEGFKLYPKAVGWSLLLSTCIIMDGFDIVLVNSLFALPSFQRKFGTEISPGDWQVSAAWQSGLANGALVGEIFGLFIVGHTSERFGYRKTLIAALTGAICFVFLLFFAVNLPMLLVGEMLCGICWGAFQTLTTTYAAEVCPVALRAYLTTYVNLCWVLGQFLASGVLKGVDDVITPFGYKLPYGLQWVWPLPLIVGIFLAPESPWWLVRRGRIDEAKKSILRLTTRNQPNFNLEETVNMIVYTNELEKANSEGTSFFDCFRRSDLRRTEITCVVWCLQVVSSLNGYSTYFFESAGLSTSLSFSLSLAEYGIGAVGTIFSWFLFGYFGRRTLYFWGLLIVAASMFVIGFMGIAPSSSTGAQWAIGAMILVSTFVYDATVGPTCYSLVAEIPSTRLRNKTVVLARNAYNVTGIIGNVLTTHMLNPSSWDWSAKAGFFWGSYALLGALWCYFRLPEPKGRSFAEMDMLFETGVSARKFRGTVVELGKGHVESAGEGLKKESVVQMEKVSSNLS